MKKLEMIKTVGGVIVSLGVSNVVFNVIRATTPAPIGAFTKVCMLVGGAAMANMASTKVADFAEMKFDEVLNCIRNSEEVRAL